MGRLNLAEVVVPTYLEACDPVAGIDGVVGTVAEFHHHYRVASDCPVGPDDGVFLELAFVRLRCSKLA
jgi:hypothetical protein